MSTPKNLDHDDLREGDLLAFLDGVASPTLGRHIAGCARCQAELRGLRAAEALLSFALERADCPAPELLLRWEAGLLPQPEAQGVAGHVAACAHCAEEAAILATPPEPSLTGRLARAGVRLVRLLLQPTPPPALALRGAAPAARQLVFAAEGYEIVVVVAPERPASRYQIEGQLLTPAGAQAGTARLSGSAQEGRAAPVDELGFFLFDAVPPGAYALELELPDAQVLAELLEVP